MTPTFFKTQQAFRKWFEKNHTTETAFVVGFYKVDSGKQSITWSESVNQALCYGWIDGVRKSIDKDSYQIRFTPRKKSSIWSAVNIKKVEVLSKKGLMKEVGLAIFNLRTGSNLKGYSFESKEFPFSPEFEKLFKANKKAWDYYQALAPGYRKTSSHWVMSAKQEITRIKRMQELISDSTLETNKWKDSKYSKK